MRLSDAIKCPRTRLAWSVRYGSVCRLRRVSMTGRRIFFRALAQLLIGFTIVTPALVAQRNVDVCVGAVGAFNLSIPSSQVWPSSSAVLPSAIG
jgi:hypothetical protein